MWTAPSRAEAPHGVMTVAGGVAQDTPHRPGRPPPAISCARCQRSASHGHAIGSRLPQPGRRARGGGEQLAAIDGVLVLAAEPHALRDARAGTGRGAGRSGRRARRGRRGRGSPRRGHGWRRRSSGRGESAPTPRQRADRADPAARRPPSGARAGSRSLPTHRRERRATAPRRRTAARRRRRPCPPPRSTARSAARRRSRVSPKGGGAVGRTGRPAEARVDRAPPGARPR